MIWLLWLVWYHFLHKPSRKVYLILRVACHAQKKLALTPIKRPWLTTSQFQIPQVILLKSGRFWRCSLNLSFMISYYLKKKRWAMLWQSSSQAMALLVSLSEFSVIRFTLIHPCFHPNIHNCLCSAWLLQRKCTWGNLILTLMTIFNPRPREKLKQRRIMRSCLKDGHHLNVLWKTFCNNFNSKIVIMIITLVLW